MAWQTHGIIAKVNRQELLRLTSAHSSGADRSDRLRLRAFCRGRNLLRGGL